MVDLHETGFEPVGTVKRSLRIASPDCRRESVFAVVRLLDRVLVVRKLARGLLDWSQHDLANQAGIGIVTVRQVEAGITEPRRATLVVLRQGSERAGVEFIDENGGGPASVCASVRGRRSQIAPSVSEIDQ